MSTHNMEREQAQAALHAHLADALLQNWYGEVKRDLPWRRTNDPYRIWISEVMLQQTRVEAVIPYYERFLQTCPTVQHLAEAPEAVYLKLWEGLGYYSRVRNLHRAAVQICTQHGGQLPADFAALRALSGIGDYTAGAIGSIAFGLPVPAVDGNVLRVMARLTNDDRSVDDVKIKRELTALTVACLPKQAVGDFNQALMELGATVCIPNGAPKCYDCPAQHLCQGYAYGTAANLPTRAPKKVRTLCNRTVMVCRYQGLVGIQQRPESGLLARLWELPAYESHLQPAAMRAQLEADGYVVEQLLSLRPAKHIFTHIEWHMMGYYVELAEKDPRLTWVTPQDLHGVYALPSAFRAFVKVVKQ